MAANGISTLASKEARQIAKLNLAQTKRQAAGDTSSPAYRELNTYDLDLLPTKFSGNTVVDNANTGGLVAGRPWTASVVSVVSDGLTLRLDASSYSGSGTNWADTSTNSANITLVGSPTYTSGTPDYFTFNGTTQYGTGAKANVLPTTSYTKSVWFYLNGYTDNNLVSSATGGHFMFMGATPSVDKKLYCGHANWTSFGLTYASYPSTANIELSTWYCATLTFNTTDGMKLYINGIFDSSFTTNKSAHNGDGSTNIASFGGGNFLNGRIGEVLCYNRTLTAAEVLQNFNASKTEFGL